MWGREGSEIMSTYARPVPASPPERGLLRADEIEGVLKPLEEANPLPARIYADPNVFAAEQARILRREWIPAGALDQVRNPGDYFTVEILEEPLLVVCDPDGGVRTYYNVCRHRAMLVAQGAGNQPHFQCPYHAWTYDGRGQLVHAPMMEMVSGFCIADIRLLEVRTEVWQNLVMINFDPDAEPLAPRLQALSEFLAPWDLPNMRLVLTKPFHWPVNWKLMFENGNEGYHVMALHRNSAQRALPTEAVTVEPLDGQHYTTFHMPYIEAQDSSKDWLGREGKAPYVPPAIPGLPESGYRQVDFIGIFPCLHISLQHDSMTAYTIFPHGRDRLTYSWLHHMPPECLGQPGFKDHVEAQGEMIEAIQAEDNGALLHVQKGWASAGAAPTFLSHLEATTWQFQRWYAERMRR